MLTETWQKRAPNNSSFIRLVIGRFITHMHFENVMYVYMFSGAPKGNKESPKFYALKW
jgi:hypothetical protein